jgi:hypothetical protein
MFRAWYADRRVSALPATPESVAAFLASEVERGIRPATIGRRVAIIRYAHKLAGHAVPTDHECVKATVRGIRRRRKKAASQPRDHAVSAAPTNTTTRRTDPGCARAASGQAAAAPPNSVKNSRRFTCQCLQCLRPEG